MSAKKEVWKDGVMVEDLSDTPYPDFETVTDTDGHKKLHWHLDCGNGVILRVSEGIQDDLYSPWLRWVIIVDGHEVLAAPCDGHSFKHMIDRVNEKKSKSPLMTHGRTIGVEHQIREILEDAVNELETVSGFDYPDYLKRYDEILKLIGTKTETNQDEMP